MKENFDINIAKEILRLRLSQMIVNEKYKAGFFKIPIHLAMGHEAIAVAVDAVMQGGDQLICSHRNMHYNLARAKTLKPILAEYLLAKEGLAGAKLGSMNLANAGKNLIYTSSILGNNLPVAAGVALGQKVKGRDSLVIVETGDGAMEEGSFYESLLFMKSNALAALVIIENNEWSLATKIEERRSHVDLPKFAEALGATYEKLAGNDVYAYIEALKKIRERILKYKIPMVLEVNLHSLGGWFIKNDDGSKGRYINYHAGPTPEITLADWPEIEQSANDPIFVLREHFDEQVLKTAARDILNKLQEETGIN